MAFTIPPRSGTGLAKKGILRLRLAASEDARRESLSATVFQNYRLTGCQVHGPAAFSATLVSSPATTTAAMRRSKGVRLPAHREPPTMSCVCIVGKWLYICTWGVFQKFPKGHRSCAACIAGPANGRMDGTNLCRVSRGGRAAVILAAGVSDKTARVYFLGPQIRKYYAGETERPWVVSCICNMGLINRTERCSETRFDARRAFFPTT